MTSLVNTYPILQQPMAQPQNATSRWHQPKEGSWRQTERANNAKRSLQHPQIVKGNVIGIHPQRTAGSVLRDYSS
ncbi:hypothetical protein TNCT_480791 [Trichonephila clavata]|uniref:Uncharacterized protein n=1 Tax=Trichonephila clavata TaxID=2740835 RepID=A0A8X6KQ78_TRICU|nr:hypothetical protein TNCT_480791 [Trichonephila clavata]